MRRIALAWEGRNPKADPMARGRRLEGSLSTRGDDELAGDAIAVAFAVRSDRR